MSPGPSGDASYTSPTVNSLDAVVVGAGFAGLYMLHRLRGLGLRTRVLEAADDIGGVWFCNRYPGARCDGESLQYSYSFDADLQQEWDWTERFATQEEILRYINHVADRFDLRRDISLRTRVSSAEFDETAAVWRVTIGNGHVYRARWLIMATGCLSVPSIPSIEGLSNFAGQVIHTADWPKDADLRDKNVGVIGTGSSGTQLIPVVAKEARSLVVFQRTPNYSVPAQNAPLSKEQIEYWRTNYPALRQRTRWNTPGGTIHDFSDRKAVEVDESERQREFEARWQKGGTNFLHAFKDLMVDPRSNESAAAFVRSKIAALVKDRETAASLTPTDFPIGAKRLCLDSGYYETFNRPNVILVDLRKEPLEEILPEGVRTSRRAFNLDTIVLATGFDAMTGALLRIDIRGRNGQRLADSWASGPKTFLGLMVAGFPNMFTITGPGSPSVIGSVMTHLEQHVEWIADCIASLSKQDARTIEARPDAQEKWTQHVDEVANTTLFPKARTWYTGANIDGKPRGFMPYVGGTSRYNETCAAIARSGYEGFDIR
jgi:cyclohexanone monooxygenase